MRHKGLMSLVRTFDLWRASLIQTPRSQSREVARSGGWVCGSAELDCPLEAGDHVWHLLHHEDGRGRSQHDRGGTELLLVH